MSYFQPTQDIVILTDASHSAAIVAPAAGGPAAILSKQAADLLLDSWFGAAPRTLSDAVADGALPADVEEDVQSWMSCRLKLAFSSTPPALSALAPQPWAAGADLPLARSTPVRAAGDGKLTSRKVGGWTVHLHESIAPLPEGTVPALDGVVAFELDGKMPVPQMQVMKATAASGCGACGACGVCGGCVLCAEVNFFVGAAAATALAALVALSASVNLEAGVA